MTLWRSGGAETAASAATSGTDDLEGALAREHGPLVRVARAVRDRIAPRVQDARPRPRRPACRKHHGRVGDVLVWQAPTCYVTAIKVGYRVCS